MNERRSRASSNEAIQTEPGAAPPTIAPSGPVSRIEKKAKAPDAVDYKIVVCPFCNGSDTSPVPESKDTVGPNWRRRQCNNGCVEKKNGKQQPRQFKEFIHRGEQKGPATPA